MSATFTNITITIALTVSLSQAGQTGFLKTITETSTRNIAGISHHDPHPQPPVFMRHNSIGEGASTITLIPIELTLRQEPLTPPELESIGPRLIDPPRMIGL